MTKKSLCVLACLLCLASAAEAQPVNPQYAWTLSASNVDPSVNTGPFVPGILNLYLWLACTNSPMPGGMSAAEFGLTTSNPANVFLAFTPLNGFLNAGAVTDPLLAVGGCPAGPLLAADILVLSNAPGQYCIGPNTVSGMRQVFDCEAAPATHEMAFVGFANDGGTPCGDAPDPFCPIPVTLESFTVE